MGKALLLISIIGVCLSALARPWIGVASYYLLALLGPQYIWWWVFEGTRVSFLVALFTIIGMGWSFFNGRIDAILPKLKKNAWMLVLWGFVVLSYLLGPYVSLANETPGLQPQALFSVANKTFLFFFCGIMLVDTFKKVQWLGYVFLLTGICLISWANLQYLSSNWAQFNMGRLMGPQSISGAAIYNDENNFAMLFVTSLPFIFYFGFFFRNRLLRYGLWSFLLLGVHAIFLTGSRGGLLGVAAITLLGVMISNKKIYAVFILLVLLSFYQWQATETMKDRSEIISQYEGESSAEDRLNAWQGGARMIVAHPVFGVGMGSYHVALPHFIESRPMVAHNTLIQFAAESGIGAGIAYLALICTVFFNYFRIKTWCGSHPDHPSRPLAEHVNNACSLSFAGLVVCSSFLSLNYFEVFFFLMLMSNSLQFICAHDKGVTP